MEKDPISVKNISIAHDKLMILDGISFDVKKGEFIALVGKSGVGKTTLLNSLAGFIKHDGEICINGDIGFCFQSHSLFYWMTVAENIDFGLDGVPTSDRKRIVDDVLKKIDLVNHGNKYPQELSGGQMQRVALGRAISYNPTILLLDEPFSSLDIHTRDQMIDWVAKLVSQLNITVVMATHYLDEALMLADRIFVLDEKKILTEINVPFERPRDETIRYSDKFQKSKQDLAKYLNHQ